MQDTRGTGMARSLLLPLIVITGRESGLSFVIAPAAGGKASALLVLFSGASARARSYLARIPAPARHCGCAGTSAARSRRAVAAAGNSFCRWR